MNQLGGPGYYFHAGTPFPHFPRDGFISIPTIAKQTPAGWVGGVEDKHWVNVNWEHKPLEELRDNDRVRIQASSTPYDGDIEHSINIMYASDKGRKYPSG